MCFVHSSQALCWVQGVEAGASKGVSQSHGGREGDAKTPLAVALGLPGH